MIGKNSEVVAWQVLMPFFDRSGYGNELPYISRRIKKLRTKKFAKESNGMTLLGKNNTHSNP